MEKQTKPIDPIKKTEYNKKYYTKIREIIKSSGVELKKGRPRKQIDPNAPPKTQKKRGRPPGSKNKKNKNKEQLNINDKKNEEKIS